MGKGRTFLTITSITSVCLIQFYWGAARTQNNLFVPLPSDETQTIITNKPQKIVYQPASTERDIMNMTDELGFNTRDNPLTCKIWNDPKATTDAIHGSLTAYTKDLDKYNELIKKFEPVSSIMNKIKHGDEEEQSVNLTLSIGKTKGDNSLNSVDPLFPGDVTRKASSILISPLSFDGNAKTDNRSIVRPLEVK